MIKWSQTHINASCILTWKPEAYVHRAAVVPEEKVSDCPFIWPARFNELRGEANHSVTFNQGLFGDKYQLMVCSLSVHYLLHKVDEQIPDIFGVCVSFEAMLIIELLTDSNVHPRYPT